MREQLPRFAGAGDSLRASRHGQCHQPHGSVLELVVVLAISVITDHHCQRAAERRLNDSRIRLLEEMGELDLPDELEARRQALLNLVAPTPYRWRPVLVGSVAIAVFIAIATQLTPAPKRDTDYPAQVGAMSACYLEVRLPPITDAQLILCMRGQGFRFDEKCDAGQPTDHPRCYRPAL